MDAPVSVISCDVMHLIRTNASMAHAQTAAGTPRGSNSGPQLHSFVLQIRATTIKGYYFICTKKDGGTHRRGTARWYVIFVCVCMYVCMHV